ncbi:MAG TPA: kelch repeat-containing protein [Candidatus Udaeobacter sp.]|jgi:N-acetylneuraminic acid mutarotase
MKNQAQLKTAITSLRNNTDNAGQAKRPLYKLEFALIITALAVSATAAWAGVTAGTWSQTGSMSVGRFSFTATVLQNGKVLVAGGNTPGEIITNTAELYAPATGTFTPTGNMHQARVGFSATRLLNGKVLVEGGASNTQEALKTAELYDPATGTWSTTGNMKEGRQQHSAVLLTDGSVLVTGGNIDRTPCTVDVCVNTIAESELYSPSTGQWQEVGDMTIPRSFFTTTLLANGKVLAVGGRIHTGPDYFDYHAIAWADLYDPTTKKWTATGTMSISREDHSAVLLANGQLLVMGGTTVDFNGVTVASAELYNPATGTWTITGSMLQGRERFTATLLQNGQLLVAGGDYYDGVNGGVLTACELYDPTLGTWSATASMDTPRFGAKAVLLRNRQVLEAGGDTDFINTFTASTELYAP